MGGLSKGLIFSTDSGNAAGVGGQESSHTARTIVDFEFGTIWLVGAGLATVVFVVGNFNEGSKYMY